MPFEYPNLKRPILTFQKPQPNCKLCNNLAHFRRKSKLGFNQYHPYCASCIKENKKKYKYEPKPRSYRKHLKETCECCGFKPIHTCQLDIDHRDGNHKNNDIKNLQTLCANCHRLKSYLNKDYFPSKNKEK